MAICTALDLRDSTKCAEEATAANDRFCRFHARQVQGLYEGYKKRTADLDRLAPPRCLPKNLVNTDFPGISDLVNLGEIHSYLVKRFNLVTRCVLARDFHHSHFYADDSDYGHDSFLARLRSQRAILTNALQRLEKRVLNMQYSKAQWYLWVETLQAEADANSEAEQKKIKAESVLFKEHQKNMNKLREEAEAERRVEEEREEVWDPIEQIISDARAGYVSLIKVLTKVEGVDEREMQLAVKRAEEIGASAEAELAARRTGDRADRLLLLRQRQVVAAAAAGPPEEKQGFQHERSHSEGVKDELEKRNRRRMAALGLTPTVEDESKGEGASRKEPVKKKRSGKKGKGGRGRRDPPRPPHEEGGDNIGPAEDSESDPLDSKDPEDAEVMALTQRAAELIATCRPESYAGEEGAARVRAEVRSVHEYLLLRTIVTSPSLLSVAINSPSVDAFLDDTSVRNTDLRDLALRLSRPTDESIRNACADCWAAEKVGDTENTEEEEEEVPADLPPPKEKEKGRRRGRKGRRQKKPVNKMSSGNGKKAASGDGKRGRVRVCGRWVYNYPEAKMPRRGWLQFAVLTGATIFTAAGLCKSWKEFYELNILSLSGYFRGLGNGWDSGAAGSPLIAHLRQIGFIPYGLSNNSVSASGFTQSPRHSRGSGRPHAATEARNYIAANMSRDDPRVWRFISLVQTHKAELIVYVRDCMTGEIIVEPPDEEKWIIRDKLGTGRLHRGKWVVRQPFDKNFKAGLERDRLWKFNFRDCLDTIIWDRLPARPPEQLQYSVMKLLHKAFKFSDRLAVLEPTLEMYYKTAKEEEGISGETTVKIREVKRSIREHRRNADPKTLRGGNPARRSGQLFYDSVDETVDKMWPYDSLPGMREDFAGVKELVERHKAETDEEEAKRLEQAIIAAVVENIHLELKNKETTIDDDLKDDEEDFADDGGSEGEWADEDSEDDEDIGVLARYENIELYEQAEDFSRIMFEQQIESNPEKAKHYQVQRNFLNNVGRRQGRSMNNRTRQKLEKRQQEVMAGSPFLPQNFIRCQYIIDQLWDETPLVPYGEVIETGEGFEALRDNAGRAAQPPPRRPLKAPEYAIAEWDKLRPKAGESMDDYVIPREWEHAIQKEITRLWKSGLIKPSWAMVCVPVFVGRAGPDERLHLYADYRGLVTTGQLRSPVTADGSMKEPPGPKYLRQEMEKFESKYPGSTYSLLRVASEPDCWPYDIGEEGALNTAILDREGRIWEWTKAPKDMPWSEHLMHDYVWTQLRDPPSLGPINEKDSARRYTRHRVDTILVMGETDDLARNWSTLSLGYVRKLPYSFSIDLARSFFRVKAEFLRNLQECWWE